MSRQVGGTRSETSIIVGAGGGKLRVISLINDRLPHGGCWNNRAGGSQGVWSEGEEVEERCK